MSFFAHRLSRQWFPQKGKEESREGFHESLIESKIEFLQLSYPGAFTFLLYGKGRLLRMSTLKLCFSFSPHKTLQARPLLSFRWDDEWWRNQWHLVPGSLSASFCHLGASQWNWLDRKVCSRWSSIWRYQFPKVQHLSAFFQQAIFVDFPGVPWWGVTVCLVWLPRSS